MTQTTGNRGRQQAQRTRFQDQPSRNAAVGSTNELKGSEPKPRAQRPLQPGRQHRAPPTSEGTAERPPSAPHGNPAGERERDNPPRSPAAPSALPPGRAPHLRADVGHEGRLGRLGSAAQHGSGRLPSAPPTSGTAAASRHSSSARPRPRHPAHGTRPPRHSAPPRPAHWAERLSVMRAPSFYWLAAVGRECRGSTVSVPRCWAQLAPFINPEWWLLSGWAGRRQRPRL